MERLPQVDVHGRTVAASPRATWRALVAALAGPGRSVPAPLAAVWGLEHRARGGDWPAAGSTTPGFAVAESDPPRRLTLRGGHRFSRYELTFTLTPAGPGRVDLHAGTAAAFPGLLGRAYRAAVIGSGGHAWVVCRLLARVAHRAELQEQSPQS